jgi:hypothetical protein
MKDMKNPISLARSLKHKALSFLNHHYLELGDFISEESRPFHHYSVAPLYRHCEISSHTHTLKLSSLAVAKRIEKPSSKSVRYRLNYFLFFFFHFASKLVALSGNMRERERAST